MVLAGLLGLSGLVLLILARPTVTRFSERSSDRSAVEIRRVARDAPWLEPEDGSAPVPRPVVRPRPGRTEPPAPPAATIAETAPPRSFGDLGAVLRASNPACLDTREALLSAAERDLCRERLGALARKTPLRLTSITPEKRADYDAVARAQAPRRAIVPLAARGASGLFGADDRLRAGRGPRVGCSMKFGPNAEPPSSGPCFVRPATGPPTPETTLRKSY